jgi:hypothetical protein
LAECRGEFLHELYLPDWPHFRAEARELAQCQEGLAAASPTAAAQPRSSPVADEFAAAVKLAAEIKNVARAHGDRLPPSLLQDAKRSPVSRYIANKLVWDPTADTSWLIREFSQRAGSDP